MRGLLHPPLPQTRLPRRPRGFPLGLASLTIPSLRSALTSFGGCGTSVKGCGIGGLVHREIGNEVSIVLLAPWTVVGGNPAKFIKKRVISG